MAVHSQVRYGSRRREQGYVMLVLLLMIALIIISAAAIVPTIKFQIQYDREEEMIHRGVQYERAIRTYYKKFGRYPIKIEDLENTNNLRFLRKRYKDPMNCSQGKCQDFRLLHFGEVQLAMSGGFGGGAIAGASPIGSPAGLGGASGLGQASGFGGSSGFGQSSSFGGNSGFGSNSSSFGGNQTAGNAAPGADSSQSSSSGAGSQAGEPNSSTPGDDTSSGSSTASASGGTGSAQLLAGGPIVGVATFSKKTGYREFNHKKKYNEWQFIYDPGTDRGGLPTGPYQPSLQFGAAGAINPNGQNGSNSSGTGSSFGTGNSFGSGSSFGNSPSGTQNSPNSPSGGFGTPSQPSNPQQQ